MEQLRQTTRQSTIREGQLAIDPAYFYTLPATFPAVRGVEVQLRRGRLLNEMSKFRYDAFLDFGLDRGDIGGGDMGCDDRISPVSSAEVADWQTHRWTPTDLRAWLAERQPASLQVNNIPNLRIAEETNLLAALHRNGSIASSTGGSIASSNANAAAALADRSSDESEITVRQLRQAIATARETGIEPEDWWQLETEVLYRIQVSPSPNDPACYCLCCQHRDTSSASGLRVGAPQPADAYANDPLRGRAASRLQPVLRSFLN